MNNKNAETAILASHFMTIEKEIDLSGSLLWYWCHSKNLIKPHFSLMKEIWDMVKLIKCSSTPILSWEFIKVPCNQQSHIVSPSPISRPGSPYAAKNASSKDHLKPGWHWVTWTAGAGLCKKSSGEVANWHQQKSCSRAWIRPNNAKAQWSNSSLRSDRCHVRDEHLEIGGDWHGENLFCQGVPFLLYAKRVQLRMIQKIPYTIQNSTENSMNSDHSPRRPCQVVPILLQTPWASRRRRSNLGRHSHPP